MPKILLYSLICILAMAQATAQSNSPRELGMGGTAVASADYLSAGFTNPALLTNYSVEKDDDWGVAVPNIGISLSDRSNLLDAIDSFNTTFDELSSGGGSIDGLSALADSLNALSNRHFSAGGGSGVSIAIPSESFNAALVISTAVEADGFMEIDPNDAGLINGSFGGGVIPDIGSKAFLLASFRTEVGFAMAKEFKIGERMFAFGVTPKMQSIEILDIIASADDSLDLGGQIDNENRFTDNNFNLDFGATTMISDKVRVGLAAQNLMGGTFTGSSGYNYELTPALSTGIAYTNGPLTLAADLDLTSTTRFQEITADDSQYLRLGAETSWEWAQLRAGYIIDLEDNYASMATAGLGFSPFGVMHLDLAGAIGENSYGVALSLSFTF
ncbi:MAG: conjugal transfer protein TraF [Planctomycetota bacterium]|nr:conjugal transfer protein TraF [Planctomycetota bacterium]